ncbi:MAG: transcription elongation factor GreA [Frankiales bacterium]|nr:transcription elongation factor GreA [Frankiales bacterium]
MTDTGTESVTWLTQDAYDRLQGELAELSGPRREEVVAKIAAAREEGDLKENGGYHAAKDEQGKLEARIRQLTQLLRDARVGEAPVAAGIAGPGMVVTVVYDDDEDDAETFLIGSREEVGTADVQVYSAQSPLGKALVGTKVGETVTYRTPNGASIVVTLKEAKPYAG